MDPITIASAIGLGIKYIPELVSYLFGDNAGSVATDVGKIVQSVTGTSDPAAADAALAGNPQMVADLRKQAMEIKDREDQRKHDEKMAQMDQQKAELQAVVDSAISARNRDSLFISAGKTNWRANIMLSMAFVAVIIVAYLLTEKHVDGATAVGGFLLTAGGMFLRNISTAFDFEFGSSRGQNDAQNLLAQAPAIGGK